MSNPSVDQIHEHPRWKRVPEEVALLLLEHGSKVWGWNLHSSEDLDTINERIASGRYADKPLGWLFNNTALALGGDRTAFWVETE